MLGIIHEKITSSAMTKSCVSELILYMLWRIHPDDVIICNNGKSSVGWPLHVHVHAYTQPTTSLLYYIYYVILYIHVRSTYTYCTHIHMIVSIIIIIMVNDMYMCM